MQGGERQRDEREREKREYIRGRGGCGSHKIIPYEGRLEARSTKGFAGGHTLERPGAARARTGARSLARRGDARGARDH